MSDRTFDYIIIGAGAAGCVLAYRLSENPQIRVALLEAGGGDRHPFFHVPKANAKAMSKPGGIYPYPTVPEAATANKSEAWVRGRVLGGSTAVNGLMWVRGMPADYDAMATLTSDDWSWRHIGAAYQALEDHELGPGDTRGKGGPLKVTLPGPDVRTPLHEAVLQAGKSMGLPIKIDVNEPDDGPCIGYAARTIHDGWRQSASVAFLKPVSGRPNLSVITEAVVDKILFEGKTATGVVFVRQGKREELRARGEVILAGGALASPGILERSGIGDPGLLARLGIPLVTASPAVGERLLEHRALLMQWKLKPGSPSFNADHRGVRLGWSVMRYLATRKGPLASASFDMGAWLKSKPELKRPDVQFLIAPHSVDFEKMAQTTEPFPGMSLVVYPLRPTSAGSVHITSTDPEGLPRLVPNHRDTQEDREAMVEGLRAARRLVAQPPLLDLVEAETRPGPRFVSDAELLDSYDQFGTCAYHAVGSCRMGADEGSVVDPELRVRGVQRLRIMDTSVMPLIPAGNTQGPTMAMAWRAADVIRRTAPSN